MTFISEARLVPRSMPLAFQKICARFDTKTPFSDTTLFPLRDFLIARREAPHASSFCL